MKSKLFSHRNLPEMYNIDVDEENISTYCSIDNILLSDSCRIDVNWAIIPF